MVDYFSDRENGCWRRRPFDPVGQKWIGANRVAFTTLMLLPRTGKPKLQAAV
jgi:hypothetical protein